MPAELVVGTAMGMADSFHDRCIETVALQTQQDCDRSLAYLS